MKHSVVVAAVAILALHAPAARAQAAEAPRRAVSLLAGGFNYDRSGDGTFPMAAVRANWPLSRNVLSEVGVSYARAEVSVGNFTGPEPTFSDENTSIVAATVGVQAELPLPYVRPYIGIAAGLFGRFDPAGGDRFFRTTQQFPLGVRIPVTDRLGLRAELRARFDEHQDGGSAADTEATAGVSFRF